MRYPVRVGVGVGLAVAGSLVTAGAALGASNPQLAGLQVALARHGVYTGPVDAVLGPQTRAAIRRFQARARLVPDGIAGPRTRRALGRFGRPFFGTRAMQPGMTGWDVAVLQYLLASHGLLTAGPDGTFGPLTRAAVVRFQRSHALEPDGIVGPVTTVKLCSAAACVWKPRTAATPAPVQTLLDRWAVHYGVDRHLVRGIAWQESGYQPSVVSDHGAVGVMQVTADTWAFVEATVIGHPVAATVDGNIHVGVAYVRYLLRIFAGDTVKAVGAYFQGPASVSARGILPATQVYVDDVLALARRL